MGFQSYSIVTSREVVGRKNNDNFIPCNPLLSTNVSGENRHSRHATYVVTYTERRYNRNKKQGEQLLCQIENIISKL